MLLQLFVGGGACICNVAIHALVMTMVVRVARTVDANSVLPASLFLMAIMIATVSVLMVAHVLEVAV
jgi:hypothetical protein